MLQNQATVVAVPPQPGPQVQMLTSGPPQAVNTRSLKSLAISELAFGCLTIILSIVVVALTSQEQMLYYDYGYGYGYYRRGLNPGQGIWGGVFVVATGFLGFRTLPNSSRCMYTANISMGIISSLVSLAAGIASGWSAAAMMAWSVKIVILHALIGLLSFVSMILCLVHACACCSGVRNDQRPLQQLVYMSQQGMPVLLGQPAGQQGQVFVQQPVGQQGQVFVQQPMAQQGQWIIQQPVGRQGQVFIPQSEAQQGQVFVQQPDGQQGQTLVPQPFVVQASAPTQGTGYPFQNQDYNPSIEPIVAEEKDQDRADLPPDYSEQA